MRLLSKAVITALLALGFVTGSHAQAVAPVNPLLPVKGTREIEFRGNFSFKPSDSYALEGKYGPFQDNRFEPAVTLGFTKAGKVKSTDYGLEGNYHFPGESPTLPFLGVFFGGTSQTGVGKSVNSTAYGAQGGIKHFLNSSVAFTATLEYRHPTKKGSKDTSALLFGLATYLR